MSKKEQKQQETAKADDKQLHAEAQDAQASTAGTEAADKQQPAEGGDEKKQETPEEKIKRLEEELDHEKKEYLFLMAEFDNYRKRTLKEKGDLIRNGGEKVLADLLPVIDDFERAIDAIDKTSDIDSLKEGVNLIYNKFVNYLEKQQVKPMESTGKDFDSDIHEAVTTFPAQDESQKGKIIDTVLKGYTINDKVLRHAKVVVGQ